MGSNTARSGLQDNDAATRTASCTCSGLAVEVRGVPHFTAICACRNCRTRTGSAFGVSAYFDEACIIRTLGAPTLFRGTSRKGRWLDYRFCPRCGTTVWWTAEFRPGEIGIAAGLFVDDAATPGGAYFSDALPSWVSLGSIPLHPSGSGK